MYLTVRPLKWQWMRATTWMYSARPMHNHKGAHTLQQLHLNSSEVSEPRHPLILSEYPHEGTPHSYFAVFHLSLSSGGPLIPDVLLADGADWHRKSPLPFLWGWQWHGRTFRWAPEHFVPTCCWLLWWGYLEPPPQEFQQAGRNQRAPLNDSVLSWWNKGIAPF